MLAFLLLLGTPHKISVIGIDSPIPEAKNQILFVSKQTGNQEIYRMDLITKQVKNLTNNPAQDMNPQLSPDGKKIIFYSNRTGTNQIYSMNLNSKKVTRLTNNAADDYDPSYSPDGTKIVFKSTRSDGIGDIFVMNADGSEQKNITPLEHETEEWDPLFSHDGSKIIYVVREDGDNNTDEIYMMNIDGSNPIELTSNDVPDWYPAINPIGGEIVYTSTDPETNTDTTFVMEDDGNNKKQISHISGYSNDPSWNLEGNMIIFIHKVNKDKGNYDIYTMDEYGKDIKKVFSTNSDILSPIFL
jgi:TolB protein